ncbi:ABC transporter permease [Jiangella mangrovi]|uniref:Transport permease protein n=1 Tax=Jiangella mangrovi TaxID=1524084 RepID=A0A7W9LLM4_9ACTN|nr:ABC transporter permease [Jiangella mangrovi]MBB5788306.1 ABC-2 type transport system permease protein [Jiangella mangrovi]
MSTTTLERPVRTVATRVERPTPPSALSASLTLGWRSVLKIRRIPEQLFDVTFQPVIFILMFVYLFGGAVSGSTQEYLQFVLPGILVQTVVMASLYTGISLNTDIGKGIFDRFRSLPIWRPAALLGALLADGIRYVVAAVVCLGVGMAMGFRPDGGVLDVVAAILLVLVFAFSLSWVFALLGLVMRSAGAVQGVSMLAMFPLTFASNVFVDPSTMPGWLRAWVDVNPVSHLVTAARGLMAGNPQAGDVGWALIGCVVLVAVFAPLTVRAYRRKS